MQFHHWWQYDRSKIELFPAQKPKKMNEFNLNTEEWFLSRKGTIIADGETYEDICGDIDVFTVCRWCSNAPCCSVVYSYKLHLFFESLDGLCIQKGELLSDSEKRYRSYKEMAMVLHGGPWIGTIVWYQSITRSLRLSGIKILSLWVMRCCPSTFFS